MHRSISIENIISHNSDLKQQASSVSDALTLAKFTSKSSNMFK